MITQSFNLVLLKSLAIQFVEYSVFMFAFFMFFMLMSKLMEKFIKSKSANTKALSN